MKEIKSVTLVLENLEAVKIDRKDIGTFRLTNIKREIARLAINSISDLITSDELFMQISSDLNVSLASEELFGDGLRDNHSPLKRLWQHDDITCISLTYQDGSTEEVYTNWEDIDNGNNNKNQTSVFNEITGDLYIVISEKEDVDSYFTEELEESNEPMWSIITDVEDRGERQ